MDVHDSTAQLDHTPERTSNSAIRPFDQSDSDQVYRFANPANPTSESRQVKHALQLIESAILQFGVHGVTISFNGGKDSTVLVHLFAAVLYRNAMDTKDRDHESSGIQVKIEVSGLYFRCQSPFPEVEKFIEDCKARYNIKLMTVGDDMKKGLNLFIESHPSAKAILIGTRASDPNGFRLLEFHPTDNDWPPIMRVHPILEWTYCQVWTFLKQIQVPWCELYDIGYTSLGSSFNTFRNPHLKTHDGDDGWAPAWTLKDGKLERDGRK